MCASFRFCVSVLTLPNGNEESVLVKTRRIFCSYSPLRMRSAFGKNRKTNCLLLTSLPRNWKPFWRRNHIFLWNFCRSRLHGRNVNPHYPLEVRGWFEQWIRKFLLTLSNGHEKCVWAKKSVTLFKNSCSHSLLEARCPSGPLFGKFFFLTYMGKMSTPSLPLPTGGKAAAWTKKGCCYPNLFLTDLSGQEKVKWPKKSKNRKNSPITEKTLW